MKVAILHLSDLHLCKNNTEWLNKKVEKIVSAVWNDFSVCAKIIIKHDLFCKVLIIILNGRYN